MASRLLGLFDQAAISIHQHTELCRVNFSRLNPSHNVISNPPHLNSSAKQTCQNLSQKGWVTYKGHCYLLKRELHGPKARGHITSIASADENEYLCKLAQGQKETQFWMGENYQKGSSLKWCDGSLTTFIQRPLLSLFRAAGGLVNSLFNIKNCLTVNIGGRGEWDRSPCSKRLPFICVYTSKLMDI
ncbi:snaclec bitiscetin subunit alpha-like [Athene noctua]|uniref:snaclec bitiscetin subunit alpha-like n=1 Tax=Athene noctua TaxID=126797 RepID=UPI003EBCBFDC